MDFQKKNWQFRDLITEDELNRMEGGIEEGITKAEQAEQTANNAQATADEADQKAEQAQQTAQQAEQTAQQAIQTATQTANELTTHLVDDTIHKTSDVIRTETETKLKVEVVSSSGSETPEQGRIIFDMSQGKFFGGDGSEWV